MPLVWMRLALPGSHAKKIQPYGGVRVCKHARNPALHRGDDDAQFFVQFTRERSLQRFAGFDLAAGKFPITRIRASFGAAGEKYLAVGASQNAGHDFQRLIRDSAHHLGAAGGAPCGESKGSTSFFSRAACSWPATLWRM